MADVFISYARKDEPTAKSLAEQLDKLGYDVWWDHMLVGGANFRQKILSELLAAKSAIVVWTPDSVNSPWVLGEAQKARDKKKLIPTKVDALPVDDIPLGFSDLSTCPVGNIEAIKLAITSLHVAPSKKPAEPSPTQVAPRVDERGASSEKEQIVDWNAIKTSSDPDDFRRHMARFPDSHFLELARNRLRELEHAEWVAAQKERSPDRLRRLIKQFPGGQYEAGARRLLMSLEQSAWDATDKRSSESLAAFLRSFPGELYSREARDLIGVLREEEAENQAWSQVVQAPTKASLEAFLKQYPIGQHYREARDLLTSLMESTRRAARWGEIKDAAGVGLLRKFLEEFKSGPEVDEARKRLQERLKARESQTWLEIKDELTPAPFLRFLREHPEGARFNEAVQTVRRLPQKIADRAWEEVKDCNDPRVLHLFLDAVGECRQADEARRRIVKLGEEPPPRVMPAARSVRFDPATASPWRKRLLGGAFGLLVLGALSAVAAALSETRNFSGYNDISISSSVALATLLAMLAAVLQHLGGLGVGAFLDTSNRFARIRAHMEGSALMLFIAAAALVIGQRFYRNWNSKSSTLYPADSLNVAAVLAIAGGTLLLAALALRRRSVVAYWAYLVCCLGAAVAFGGGFFVACLQRTCNPPDNYILGQSVLAMGMGALALHSGVGVARELVAAATSRIGGGAKGRGMRILTLLLVAATAFSAVLPYISATIVWRYPAAYPALMVLLAGAAATALYFAGFALWRFVDRETAWGNAAAHASSLGLLVIWVSLLVLAGDERFDPSSQMLEPEVKIISAGYLGLGVLLAAYSIAFASGRTPWRTYLIVCLATGLAPLSLAILRVLSIPTPPMLWLLCPAGICPVFSLLLNVLAATLPLIVLLGLWRKLVRG